MIGLIVLLIISTQIFASAPKMGTSGATELLIPMGARSVSMAGANIAGVKGAEAIYWNPAGLSNVKTGEAMFSYMSYFADMKVTYLAAGVSAGELGVIGLSVQVLNIGDIAVTTWDSPEGTGEIINPNYLTLGLTYSKRFTDRILFGTSAKVISERVGTMNASAMAFDFGLQYVTPFGIGFGVTLKNLGSKVQFDGTAIEFDSEIPYSGPTATTRKTKLDMAKAELPTSMNMGLSYKYDLNDMAGLTLTGAYSNNAFELDHVKIGAEFGLMNLLFVRAGYVSYMYPDDWEWSKDSQYGLSFGMGLNLNLGGTDFMFDYANRPMALFDANQYFSVSVGF